MTPENASARSAPDLDALRAAVARIEQGESTGFFDDVEGTPADTQTQPGSAPPERASTRQTKEEALREVMARIEAAHPEGVFKPAAIGKGPVEVASPPAGEDGPGLESDKDSDQRPAEGPDNATEREADPYAVARQIVLRQLTMSPKSRQQLREKLRQRNCPDEVAEAVLDRMADVGLVDDERYAETYVRSKQVSRGLSTRALAHDLRKKGVDRDTVEAVLAEVSPMDEEERARGLVKSRLARLHGLERNVVIRRLAGMLARKGYPSGMSLQVIREAIDADPAFRRD